MMKYWCKKWGGGFFVI